MSVALEILVTTLLVIVFVLAVGSLLLVIINLVARVVERIGTRHTRADE
ncbi:MAG: hypothetical protein OEW42_12940 [Acidimicrobiia bacterium]|nr:hypothetical protein [Acidimicrobiia bacterium]MDH5238682.1 hypothetical protein [Acidimicrobiia bacterium]